MGTSKKTTKRTRDNGLLLWMRRKPDISLDIVPDQPPEGHATISKAERWLKDMVETEGDVLGCEFVLCRVMKSYRLSQETRTVLRSTDTGQYE